MSRAGDIIAGILWDESGQGGVSFCNQPRRYAVAEKIAEALRRDYRLGLLHGARIASRCAREMASGHDARRGEARKLRTAGKNIRSGECHDIHQNHSRMAGYFLDKRLTAEQIAREIRDAARRFS